MDVDVASLPDSDLSQLHTAVLAELEARQARAVAERGLAEAIEFVQNAHGMAHVQGSPYSQPTGAHDAYTLGNEVTHDGGLWRSLWAVNVWAPGTVDGAWERVGDAPTTEPGPLPLDDYPTWEPGTPIKAGDLYAYEGGLYAAVQAHTSQPDWAPDLVPALWKKVG